MKRRTARLGRPAFEPPRAAGRRSGLAVVLDGAGPLGQHVHARAGRPRARVKLLVARTSASSFSSTASAVTRLAQASWYICFRFGRSPSRHALCSGGGTPAAAIDKVLASRRDEAAHASDAHRCAGRASHATIST